MASEEALKDMLERWLVFGKAMQKAGSDLPRHLVAETEMLLQHEEEPLQETATHECICHRCIKEKNITGPRGFPLSTFQMILCPICGNKRCPHASDHNLACTGSNEAGQPGSVY